MKRHGEIGRLVLPFSCGAVSINFHAEDCGEKFDMSIRYGGRPYLGLCCNLPVSCLTRVITSINYFNERHSWAPKARIERRVRAFTKAIDAVRAKA